MSHALASKQLNHFVLGNNKFLVKISLPSNFRVAEVSKLFQHLDSNLDAHVKAMEEYVHLIRHLNQKLI